MQQKHESNVYQHESLACESVIEALQAAQNSKDNKNKIKHDEITACLIASES